MIPIIPIYYIVIGILIGILSLIAAPNSIGMGVLLSIYSLLCISISVYPTKLAWKILIITAWFIVIVSTIFTMLVGSYGAGEFDGAITFLAIAVIFAVVTKKLKPAFL